MNVIEIRVDVLFDNFIISFTDGMGLDVCVGRGRLNCENRTNIPDVGDINFIFLGSWPPGNRTGNRLPCPGNNRRTFVWNVCPTHRSDIRSWLSRIFSSCCPPRCVSGFSCTAIWSPLTKHTGNTQYDGRVNHYRNHKFTYRICKRYFSKVFHNNIIYNYCTDV